MNSSGSELRRMMGCYDVSLVTVSTELCLVS
jgi:hypothetical protein